MIECIPAENHLVLVVFASQSHEGRLNDATTKPEDEMKGWFLLDVVIGQGPSIFKLFSGENQTLLIRRNAWKIQTSDVLGYGKLKTRFVEWSLQFMCDTLLVLNLGLDIVDGVAALDLEGYGLPCQSFHEIYFSFPSVLVSFPHSKVFQKKTEKRE